MYIISYNTKYTKNILWVTIHAYSDQEAIDKLYELIPEVVEITKLDKAF